jgi:hypothetical protein
MLLMLLRYQLDERPALPGVQCMFGDDTEASSCWLITAADVSRSSAAAGRAE